MSKLINNLNIPEENKILLSKINKRVSFLNDKTNEYFNNSMAVRHEHIEIAYVVNDDLISILNSNKEMIERLSAESLNIRKVHQKDLTRELQLPFFNQILDSTKANTILEQRSKLITEEEKTFALNKKRVYLEKRTTQKRIEMEEAISNLKRRVEEEKSTNIEAMTEDVRLIEKYIEPKLINKSRWMYTFVLVPTALVLISFLGVILWII